MSGASAYCNDQEEIHAIESYLNSLKHIAAKFTQIDASGSTQFGNFFLSRPGKLKWEYLRPKKITILFNGEQILYHNKELDQKSEYKTQDSLIYFLISPKIQLSNPDSEYYLQSFGNNGKELSLEIKKKNQLKDETLVIKFNKSPLKLIGIEMKDSLSIFISSIIEYRSLDKNLFKV